MITDSDWSKQFNALSSIIFKLFRWKNYNIKGCTKYAKANISYSGVVEGAVQNEIFGIMIKVESSVNNQGYTSMEVVQNAPSVEKHQREEEEKKIY